MVTTVTSSARGNEFSNIAKLSRRRGLRCSKTPLMAIKVRRGEANGIIMPKYWQNDDELS
jgi:hypothetical protein